MPTIIVIGDIILDHNIYTKVQNPKLKDYNTEYNFESENYTLGGCGNVVSNIHALGGNTIFLFSAVGNDEYGTKLKSIVDSLDIHSCIETVEEYNTTVKHRFYCNSSIVFQHANNINKHLLLHISFLDTLESVILENKVDCIIICESEKSSVGLLYPNHCKGIIDIANRYNVQTIVDPKEDVCKYRNCTIIKPNRDEAYTLFDANLSMQLQHVHTKIIDELNCKYSVITLSEDGISVYDQTQEIIVKCIQPIQCIDPIGGGDVVTSIFSVFLTKLDIKTCSFLATCMASKSTEKPGCVTITRQEVIDTMFPGKIISFENLHLFKTLFQHKIVGFTTGCFDLFHAGHKLSLKWCKENCEILVVCLASDNVVKLLKGDSRPIQNESIRLAKLLELDYIDYIVMSNERDTTHILKILQPQFFMKGGDYLHKSLTETDYEELRIGPFLQGISTTQILSGNIQYGKNI
jgi:D-beta-D-heptose 7-phosphate kinase/D-beta-D-heptose 1-phosphate adenosyltransferase